MQMVYSTSTFLHFSYVQDLFILPDLVNKPSYKALLSPLLNTSTPPLLCCQVHLSFHSSSSSLPFSSQYWSLLLPVTSSSLCSLPVLSIISSSRFSSHLSITLTEPVYTFPGPVLDHPNLLDILLIFAFSLSTYTNPPLSLLSPTCHTSPSVLSVSHYFLTNRFPYNTPRLNRYHQVSLSAFLIPDDTTSIFIPVSLVNLFVDVQLIERISWSPKLFSTHL